MLPLSNKESLRICQMLLSWRQFNSKRFKETFFHSRISEHWTSPFADPWSLCQWLSRMLQDASQAVCMEHTGQSEGRAKWEGIPHHQTQGWFHYWLSRWSSWSHCIEFYPPNVLFGSSTETRHNYGFNSSIFLPITHFCVCAGHFLFPYYIGIYWAIFHRAAQ